MLPYNNKLKPPSRHLRNEQTDAEEALWYRIRRKQILGVQFYRQKPILNFIVDFYAPAVGLVIECDGSQHYTPEGVEADRARTKVFEDLNLTVLRFDNRQILLNTDAVCQQIYDVMANRIGHEV
jgi:very-short-patch-repair endonuclease